MSLDRFCTAFGVLHCPEQFNPKPRNVPPSSRSVAMNRIKKSPSKRVTLPGTPKNPAKNAGFLVLRMEHLEDRVNPSGFWETIPSLQPVEVQAFETRGQETIVFIDTELLKKGSGEKWLDSRLVPLDHELDLVQQITAGLSTGSNWDQVRLITHGSPGTIHLGNQKLDGSTLAHRSLEIQAWGAFLAPGADLLLYGCSIAATEMGEGFVERLAKTVGSDVAASTNITGKDGDSDLEYSTGFITTFLEPVIDDLLKTGFSLNVFNDPITLPTTSNSFNILTGDFNNDGYDDIATANEDIWLTNTPVNILINNKNGGFNMSQSIPISGWNTRHLASADFNNDGNIDIAISIYATKTMVVMFGSGDGLFSGSTTYNVGNNTSSDGAEEIATGDFNNDGKIDIAVASVWESCISVYFNDGLGNFDNKLNISTSSHPYFVKSGDLNNDSIDDLFVSYEHQGPRGYSVLISNGNNSFQNIKTTFVEFGDFSLSDFDSDGILDFVSSSNSANLTEKLIWIYKGDGFGNFLKTTTIITTEFGRHVTSYDFDRDLHADIIIKQSGQLSFYKGLGNFLFDPPEIYTFGSSGISGIGKSAIFDFRNTNSPSLVVSEKGSNLYIFENNSSTFTTTSLSGSSQKIYGETADFVMTVVATAGIPGGTVSLKEGTNVLGSGTLNALGKVTFSINPLNAGTHSLTAEYAGAPGFKASVSTPLSFTVLTKSLTITADNKSKVYGNTLPAFTTTITGLVNGDTASSISGLGVVSTATGSSGVGNYSLDPAGTNANYAITLVTGSLEVTQAPLTVSADNKSKIYGQALPLFSTTVTGLVNGDTSGNIIGLGATTTATASSIVGNYPIVASGTNTNYQIALVDGTITVTKAPLTITADAKSKLYG
ncbi:MAG: DUF4347 domain-containing protein, partial [Gemmataceae bacterium]|nr:DUF4347 domain-containing protein [Gemmataceae bacterium]